MVAPLRTLLTCPVAGARLTDSLPTGRFVAVDIAFLFARGLSVTEVARAAGVDSGTASKWKSGKQKPDWIRICRLYARGVLTDDDLRAAGLAIPRTDRQAPADLARAGDAAAPPTAPRPSVLDEEPPPSIDVGDDFSNAVIAQSQRFANE